MIIVAISKIKEMGAMAKYTALTVAHWFINRNRETEDDMGAEKMTLLKLLKLLYYAEGCHLAIYKGKSLFGEDIMAWEHGPVVVEVYQAYSGDPYNLPLSEADIADACHVGKEDQDLLEQVFQVFGQYSAWALRNKTHSETPWLEATGNGQHLGTAISRKTMEDYFTRNYVA
jgi:uncharacterized phage-associated protein